MLLFLSFLLSPCLFSFKNGRQYPSHPKFRGDLVQSHLWGRLPNIWGNAQIFSYIWGDISHTVIRFLWASAKFGTCTVVNVNGTLVEEKMRRFEGECAHFSFNKCPLYTHDSASAKFNTNSHETDNSAYMTLHAIPSEFPYVWGKFDFLFYQCILKDECYKYNCKSVVYYRILPNPFRLN